MLGWVLFDFAGTIFSYVVLTRYFNEWIIIELRQPDLYIGLMSLCVSLALVLGLPFFGALADRAGRHKPFLIAFTLVSVAGTALLGVVEGVVIALVVAGIAIFAFSSAEAQYHPLLAKVAPPERHGRVSGLAIGVGYIGALVAVLGLGQLVTEGENQSAFVPTAALFLAFSLPCFLFVRERGPRGSAGSRREPFAQLLASLRDARRAPHGRFLVARFLYVDAIATVIAFMTVYARRTGDFSAGEIDLLLGLSIVFAVAGAVAAGLLVERLGPKRVVAGTVLGVVLVLLAAGITGSGPLLWVAGPLVGVALGSVSASDRVLMLRLIPPERRGEDFGLYALVGKISNGVGPLVLWGATIWVLTDGLDLVNRFDASRAAVCVLAGAALAGLLVLRRLPDPR
ncbi:MAG: MFS transporter [Solirubrobacteraceae bacterium]